MSRLPTEISKATAHQFKPYPAYKPSGVAWVGNVPEHWSLTRLKLISSRTERKVEPDVEIKLPYVGLENIESWTGKLLHLDADLVPTGISNRFSQGDTLFGKLRPYLAKACNPEFDGLCSSELLVLRPSRHDKRFFLYQLLTGGFISFVDSSTYGVRMPRASWESIGNCILPAPPQPEQRVIADFLDQKTGEIENLVAKNQALTNKLKEKRSALISQTVTRGLPPSAAQAAGFPVSRTLKASGLSELPEIPSDWTVSKVWLERVARNIDYQDGNHGELHPKADDYVSDGIPFIMANHIVAGQVAFGDCNYIEPELAATLRIGFARTGDVLLTHKGTIGRVGVVQESLFPYVVLTPQVTYYRCLRRIAARYLFWFFQGRYWQDQMHLVSSLGTTRGYVGLLDQRFLKLLLPALSEQVAIAAYLDTETAKLDALVSKVEEAMERLREHRKALISSAVTGKIDVRNKNTASGAS